MESDFVVNPMRLHEERSDRLNYPRAFHVRLAGYAPTPLLELPDLAADLGLGRLWVKDESRRYQMQSYELLGAAWALYRVVLGRLERRVRWDTVDELVERIAPVGALRIVVVADDNFGIAAARAARLFGYDALVYTGAEAAPARLAAIEREGARVVAVAGGYDAALAAAATETDDDTVILSDSSWEGFEEIPSWVTDGYTTMFEEANDELEARGAGAPDAVVVPLGVGALAASAGNCYRVERFADDLWLLGVEAADAPCFVESARAGQRVAMPHASPTLMRSLARGLPSPLAWDVVARTFDAFVAVSDEGAVDAVERLAGDGIHASASGAAALAGLIEARGSNAPGEVPLGEESSVLVVVTEAPLS